MAIPIFEANNYECYILWVCFLTSMRSVQCGLTRIENVRGRAKLLMDKYLLHNNNMFLINVGGSYI